MNLCAGILCCELSFPTMKYTSASRSLLNMKVSLSLVVPFVACQLYMSPRPCFVCVASREAEADDEAAALSEEGDDGEGPILIGGGGEEDRTPLAGPDVPTTFEGEWLALVLGRMPFKGDRLKRGSTPAPAPAPAPPEAESKLTAAPEPEPDLVPAATATAAAVAGLHGLGM